MIDCETDVKTRLRACRIGIRRRTGRNERRNVRATVITSTVALRRTIQDLAIRATLWNRARGLRSNVSEGRTDLIRTFERDFRASQWKASDRYAVSDVSNSPVSWSESEAKRVGLEFRVQRKQRE